VASIFTLKYHVKEARLQNSVLMDKNRLLRRALSWDEVALGLPEWLAIKCGFTRKGGWHVVQSPILQTTLTNERLQMRGFLPIANIYERFCHV